jgi:hypothetical protein
MASIVRPSGRGTAAERRKTDSSFWRRNALGLTCLGIFLVLALALVLTGHRTFNADQVDHGEPTVSLARYLTQGHFWEALFENWESEFLQMASYIVLTVFLVQKGSAESKDPDKHEPADDDPRDSDLRKSVPWPVRRGGVWLALYENSLLLAFVGLFLLSILGHALGGTAEYNAELTAHGDPAIPVWTFVRGSRFWFESFENWQSEFLAVFAIVTLTIRLRQRGSSESKPVAAPHEQTGPG